jgi:hypothetical protein
VEVITCGLLRSLFKCGQLGSRHYNDYGFYPFNGGLDFSVQKKKSIWEYDDTKRRLAASCLHNSSIVYLPLAQTFKLLVCRNPLFPDIFVYTLAFKALSYLLSRREAHSDLCMTNMIGLSCLQTRKGAKVPFCNHFLKCQVFGG